MSRYKVEITGINTNELEVLTNEEMRKLFERVKENDEYARNLQAQLINCKSLYFAQLIISSSLTRYKGLINSIFSKLVLFSLGIIPLYSPPYKIDSIMVSMTSSKWWPKAILLQPNSWALEYKNPRRILAQR